MSEPSPHRIGYGPRVYLAGPMVPRHDYDEGHQLIAPWRRRIGAWLVRAGIDPIYPEEQTAFDNHGGKDWFGTVLADLEAIEHSDAVFACIGKEDRDGTVAEITYAATKADKPVVISERHGITTLSGFVRGFERVHPYGGIALLQSLAWRPYLTPIELPVAMALWNGFYDYGADQYRAMYWQWPLGPYRVDFFIEPSLVIECDGVTYHSDREAVMRDKKRDRWFQERGATVLRFSSPEITGNIGACVDQIKRTAARLGKPRLRHLPIPPRGRELPCESSEE